MAKVEIFSENDTVGGLAEIERPPTKQRGEAPNIKATPSVKTPLTFPAEPSGEPSAKSEAVRYGASVPLYARR